MSFDRLAAYYDRMEAFTAGGRLQQVRTAWLDALGDRKEILSVGEGHGRFAAACLARFPEARLTCVDASPGMLARARQRMEKTVPGPVQVTWECAEILDWKPAGRRFDAIVTCFFLDCFPPPLLERVIAQLAACATPNAVWLVSDFAIPPAGLRRWRARAIHALMYAFFRVATRLPARRLTPPDANLSAQGFQRAGRREFEWGLLQADLWRRG